MSIQTPTSIGEALVIQNVISEDILNEARNLSINSGKKIEDILLEKSYIREIDIVKAKSFLFGVPFVSLENIQITKELNNLISRDEALRAKLLIFEKTDLGYKVAMSNPLDIQTIRYFEQKLKNRLIVHIALESDIISKINLTYSDLMTNEVEGIVNKAISDINKIDISESTGEDIQNIDVKNAPIAQILNKILDIAIQTKASDIHIEPTQQNIRIRYRINGILIEKLTLPIQILNSLVARIKVLSKLQIDEKRKPQDGRFEVRSADNEIDLRVSTLPTILGEKVVIRLLRKDLEIINLEDTGMRGNALKVFKEGLKATTGIIYVTGPTGSGKTVTVATSMSIINKPDVNVVSIEDPVEIRVPGVNQVQVNVDAGLTFATALRAFLRQDPDVIIVGETRDHETALLSAQASLTGHLVISTLHTNNAAGALPRLLDMGVEAYIIASSVNICAAQRLCRRICKYCKEEYEAQEHEILELCRVLGYNYDLDIQNIIQYQIQVLKRELQNILLFRGRGCEKCNGTGYAGRIGIFEVFKVSEKIGALVMQHSSADSIEKQAVQEGMIKMIQDGYMKALEGITTIEEVQRVIHT